MIKSYIIQECFDKIQETNQSLKLEYENGHIVIEPYYEIEFEQDNKLLHYIGYEKLPLSDDEQILVEAYVDLEHIRSVHIIMGKDERSDIISDWFGGTL